MPSASSASFLDALRQYRVLEADRLHEAAHLNASFPDAKSLAMELLRRDWLTPYQANHVLQGQGQKLLLGSYVLLERLGEGGMGQVLKAKNWKLGKVVALKVIRADRLANPDAIRRFQREVRAAAALSHPNIVRAYDADEVSGTHILVMEYVAGTDLAQVVKKTGPLSVMQACEYVRQTALGLQHAFERGLVHRDIKPHNLLLTADSRAVKILDMGLARLRPHAEENEVTSTLTHEGALMGTLDYIAPEQAINAHTADIRSDLYSLGCTLYYVLTKRVPFPGGSATEKLLRHQMEEPQPVEQLCPEAASEAATVVRRLMAKRPEQRYQTPAELANALSIMLSRERHAMSVETVTERKEPAANPFADLDGTSVDATASFVSQLVPASGRRYRAWTVAIVGALLCVPLVLLLAWGLWRYDPTTIAFKKDADAGVSRGRTSKVPKDEAEKKRYGEAEESLKSLIAQAGNTKTTFAEFAGPVAEFKSKYGGTPAAIKAAELLMKMPSPLDSLAATTLPKDYLNYWQASGRPLPTELVGVLGEWRRRHLRSAIAIGVAVHPDANLVATSLPGYGEDVYLWDLSTDTLRTTIRIPGGAAAALAFSPDGLVLASATKDYAIRLWSIGKPAATELHAVKVHKGDIKTLAFSPTGDRLASASFDGTLRLWKLAAGRLIEEDCMRGDRAFFDVAWFPNGDRFAACDASAVRIWDASSAPTRVVTTLNGYGTSVVGLAVSPDGRLLASGGYDNCIRLWRLDTAKPVEPLVLRGLSDRAESLAFSADGKHLASQAWDGTLRLWDCQTGKGEILAQAPSNTIGLVRLIAKRNQFVSSHADGTVRLWDAAMGKELLPLTGPVGPVTSVAFSPDCSRIVSGGLDGNVRLWDAIGRKRLRTSVTKRPVTSVKFLSREGLVALASEAEINIRDLDKQQSLSTIEGGTISTLALSPDGLRVFAGRNNGIAYSWAAGTGKPGRQYPGNMQEVRAVDISPDGSTLVIGSGNRQDKTGHVRILNVNTGVARFELPHEALVTCAAVSPDGTALAIGSGGAVKLWDASTGKELASLTHESHKDGVGVLAYAPNGGALASLGYRQDRSTVLVWDTGSLTVRKALSLPGRVNDIAFADDGRHIAAANDNGTIVIVRLTK